MDRKPNVKTLLIEAKLVVAPPQTTKPYSANWRERRQKARMIAEAYKRRKPKPVWDSPF